MNPDWSFVFYDDTDVSEYIKMEYGVEMLTKYLSIDPRYGAARADLFRYLLMYKQGGVYLDIKSVVTVPLNAIIRPTDQYLLSRWSCLVPAYPELIKYRVPGGREFQQWHIICAPSHPYLASVLDRVLSNIDSYSTTKFGVGKTGVLHTTGPIPYTIAIHSIMNSFSHRWVDAKTAGIKYNSLTETGEGQPHVELFNTHYSSFAVPVIAR